MLEKLLTGALVLSTLSKEVRLRHTRSGRMRNGIKKHGKSGGVPALVDGQYCNYVWVVDDGIDASSAVALKTPHVGYLKAM